jgi:hypothetical protein
METWVQSSHFYSPYATFLEGVPTNSIHQDAFEEHLPPRRMRLQYIGTAIP